MATIGVATTRQRRTTTFGYSLAYAQILDTYAMSSHERDNLVTMRISGYDMLGVFTRWTWPRGFVWVYGQRLCVQSCLLAEDNSPIHTAFQQALTHAGARGVAMLL